MNICGDSPIFMPGLPECTDCDELLAKLFADIQDALEEAKQYTDGELDDYVPRGTVSTPSIYVSRESGTASKLTSAGTLPSLSATYTASNKRLKINWGAGTLPAYTNQTVVTAVTGATASEPRFTGVKRNA